MRGGASGKSASPSPSPLPGGERVISSCLQHHCTIAAFFGGEAGQDLMSWS
ncbi:protein of unknown function (plasmid) [Azospirillum baldaniorum]|uniref:Uncharacterized protein n=1 Tax=Azospirillum baldaniorum TaxID=1064539 RepID=A0A9P1NQP1_9PROT|nr:protein of unknown function [Azospirillum baldaniorum]